MNKNDKNILNVPHLRFPEFTDEWNKVTLGEVTTDINYGLNLPSKEFNGKTVYIRITDIDESSRTLISSGFTSPDGELKDNLKVVKNDILIARTGASTGKSFIFDNYNFESYFAGFLIRFRPKSEYNPHFLYYNLNTKPYEMFVKLMSARSGQPGINSEEYKSYSFSIPSLNEQNKVSSFMKVIDKTIELQRKLIDLYKSLIKTLRNELFKYKSNNLLGNEINFINGYAFEPKTYDINGKFYVCTISNVSGDRYLDLTQVNKVNEIPKDLNINQQLFSGDILMSLTGNVGRISIVKYSNGLLNQRVAKIDVRNKKHSNFIYHVLSSEKFLKYVEKQSQGSSQNNLYYKNVEKFNLPNYDSNKRLLIILNEIDFLIINYSSLLQSLVDIKFFLLKNMFI